METLDGVPVGIVLLDRRGKELFFNRAASEIFAAKDGIGLGPDGLTAATREETCALRRLITGSPRARPVRPALRRAACWQSPAPPFSAPTACTSSLFVEWRPSPAEPSRGRGLPHRSGPEDETRRGRPEQSLRVHASRIPRGGGADAGRKRRGSGQRSRRLTQHGSHSRETSLRKDRHPHPSESSCASFSVPVAAAQSL